jgi:hypothetical protein
MTPSPSNRSISHDASSLVITEEGSLRVSRIRGFTKWKSLEVEKWKK